MKSSVATSDDVIRNLGIAGTFFCYDLWFVWVFPLQTLAPAIIRLISHLTPCLTPCQAGKVS